MDRRQFLFGLAGLVGGCANRDRINLSDLEKENCGSRDAYRDDCQILKLRQSIKYRFGVDILFGNPNKRTEILPSENLREWSLIALMDMNISMIGIYEGLRKYTKKIYLGELGYKIEYPRGQLDEPAGMSFHDRIGEFLMHPKQYYFRGLVHEMAHVADKFMPEEFHRRWNEVARDSNEWNCGLDTPEPIEGHIRGYGLRGPCPWPMCTKEGMAPRRHEDIATFVDEIYRPNFRNYRLADPTDRRYTEKIILLRNVDLISQEQFEGVLACLGDDFEKKSSR